MAAGRCGILRSPAVRAWFGNGTGFGVGLTRGDGVVHRRRLGVACLTWIYVIGFVARGGPGRATSLEFLQYLFDFVVNC